MPKVASAASTAAGKAAASAQNVLKRNQACHQCRKKKLLKTFTENLLRTPIASEMPRIRSDAQQPCSACIKTHAYAVKTHPATAPANPDCTYDAPGGEDPATQARMQELEAKIKQLENKLQTHDTPSVIQQVPGVTVAEATWASERNSPLSATGSRTLGGSSPSTSSAPHMTPIMGVPMSAVAGSVTGLHSVDGMTSQTSPPQPTAAQIQNSPLTANHLVQDVNLIFQYFPDTVKTPEQRQSSTSHTGTQNISPIPSPPTQRPILNLIDPNWPDRIPKPELLYHLVETFFACVPHAHRVIHKPTFMSSLVHPAASKKFPTTALLHAICAISSLYTPIVTDGSERNLMNIGPDTLFNSAIAEKRMVHDEKFCSDFSKVQIEEGAFGMNQAYYYQESWLETARRGDCLTQLLQSNIIITWYYHSVGRAVDVWIAIGNCIRTALPMGLNAGPLWTPISRQPVHTLSLFPPNADETERETLINLFWLTYCMERMYCAGTVWPLLMQDEDISQSLPMSTSNLAYKVRNKGFDTRDILIVFKQFVPPSERQRLNSPKCLTNHPRDTTDSFSLYVKSTVLLGRVKTFNGRFKTKFDGGAVGIDPRETAEFQMLDAAITAFRSSIPKEFREPMGPDGKIDPTLYLALVIPNVLVLFTLRSQSKCKLIKTIHPFSAMLLLHDPHANIDSPNCPSASRMLISARAILDLIYKLTATSFDLMLLDHSCSFCWFVGATALIRFLKAKILAGDEAETLKLTSEIQVIRFMLQNLGARTIVGLRQNMILEEMYAAEIQPLIDRVVSPPTMDDLSSAAGFFGMF
ncbi:hypothetical protein FRB90_008175 [Tulasnella sp. 427]|nr:hypothetical protein FRB90_008175 [Tulasnella sp. 427]